MSARTSSILLQTFSFACLLNFNLTLAADLNQPVAANSALRLCPTPVTYQCVSQHFDSILQDARAGDSLAVRVLYRSLSGCQSPLAVADATRPLQVTTVDTATGQRSTTDHNEAVDRYTKGLRERCASFATSQISQFEEINWLAAEAGDAQAQFNLASRISHEADENRKTQQGSRLLALLQKNVQQKHYESLSVLSTIYNDGLLVKQDRVKALAYSLAYAATLDESKRDATFLGTQRVAAQMTTTERAQAESLSHRIVQN